MRSGQIGLATGVLMVIASMAGAATDIRPAPGGKRLLFVDGNDIRPEPGGKRLLYIDGDALRDAPGGKRLIYIDGKDIRPAPGGIRLAFLDGKDLRRTPGGKRLLFIEGTDIRPEPGGPRLLFIDGDALSRQQLIAVLFVLKPELFKLSAEEEASLKKAMAEAGAESAKEAARDKVVGKYTTLTAYSADGKKVDVDVTITKPGNVYLAQFNFKNGGKFVGAGIKEGEEAWFAISPDGMAALGVYKIEGGKLTGTWYPSDGDEKALGSEQLVGSEKIAGDYKITAGKLAKSGVEYTGALSLAAVDGKSVNSDPAYQIKWANGAVGVGFKAKNFLVFSAGVKDYQIIRFKIDAAALAGDFYRSDGVTGYYTLGHAD